MLKIIPICFFLLLLLTSCAQPYTVEQQVLEYEESGDEAPVLVQEKEQKQELTYETKHSEESTEAYLVRVDYPEFSFGDQEIEARINAGIKNKVDILTNNFKDIVGSDEPILDTPDLGSQIDISYEVYSYNQNIISLAFNYYSYVSGAAHGFNGYEVFNYDLVNEKEIGLVDLFVVDSNYLEALSYMATEYFDDKFEETDWFRDGVEPDGENFANFVLTDEAIIFLFDNYAIVPYVLGVQEWEVEYDDIGALLAEDGVIDYLK